VSNIINAKRSHVKDMGILRPSVSDYSLTLAEEHREIQKLAREFAENEVGPIADKIDKEDKIPVEIVRKIGELGFLGVPYPAEFGGVGSDYLSMAIVIEELARISCAVSVLPVAHTLAAMPIYVHGTEEQKKKYLVPLAEGKKIGAHAMTEAAAGSDIAGIRSVARKEGDTYVINGSKVFCTNGDIAETFVIFARTNPPKEKRQLGISAFIVERGMKGFTVGKPIGKTGIHGSQSVELVMEDLVVPHENLLGEEDKGFYLALDCYDHGRIEVAAQGVGVGQAAMEAAAKYTAQRVAFGQPLLEFQGPQFMLGESSAEVSAARLLTYWAASLKDQGKDFAAAASMAKMYATEAGERAALLAIKLGGSAGVATEYPMERFLRDIQVTKIYEGTNDIQRLTLGRIIYKEAKVILGQN